MVPRLDGSSLYLRQRWADSFGKSALIDYYEPLMSGVDRETAQRQVRPRGKHALRAWPELITGRESAD
jgi:hypothetical protein